MLHPRPPPYGVPTVPISWKSAWTRQLVVGNGMMDEHSFVGDGASSEQRAPALDAEVLRSLRELQGDGAYDLVADLAAIFLADAPTQIAAMRAAISTGSAVELRLAAHTLKGSAATLGAAQLAALCTVIEVLGHAGTVAGTAERLAAVDQELERVRGALEHPAH